MTIILVAHSKTIKYLTKNMHLSRNVGCFDHKICIQRVTKLVWKVHEDAIVKGQLS